MRDLHAGHESNPARLRLPLESRARKQFIRCSAACLLHRATDIIICMDSKTRAWGRLARDEVHVILYDMSARSGVRHQ